MRWFHQGIDRLQVAAMRRCMPYAFRDGLGSPPLREHVAAIDLTLPALNAPGPYTLRVHTLAGELEAGFQLWPGPQPHLPVVVYHHGVGEMPADKSFWGIFRARQALSAHLVLVRAPFHRSWLDLATGVASMHHFLALCAVALQLGEALRLALLAQGATGSLVTGTSLGGFLSLIHHLFLGTASAYVPLLAGPDIAHVLLHSHFRYFVAPQALVCPEQFRSLLDFRQEFLTSHNTQRVFPLLARHDFTMQYDHHAACYRSAGVPVVTIERGHITGALAFAMLRAHVRGILER